MKITAILFAFLYCLSCTSGQSLLVQAYESKSYKPLDKLFQQWHDATPPISATELARQSDTVQIAYELFALMFDSLLARIYDPTSPRDSRSRYHLVQKEVRYYVTDSIDLKGFHPRSTFGQGIITPFRPVVSRPGIIVAYLTDEREKMLVDFMKPDEATSRAGDSAYPRRRFLWPYLTVKSRGMLKTRWLFDSPPGISAIEFDTTLRRAKVFWFLHDDTYMRFVLERQQGEWVVLDRAYYISVE